jgi:hypothetical protein
MRNKLVMLDSNVYLNQTPIFEWFVVWCDSKNGYQKDMCLNMIGPHNPNVIIVLGSIINIIRGGPP